MGANLQMFGFDDKIKTVEAAQKDFAKRAEQDRYENGHSYSGGIGMLGRLRYIDRVFKTWDEFSDYMEDKDKGDGVLARLVVYRDIKPLIAARQKAREAGDNLWQGQRLKKAPSVIRTLKARVERAAARVKVLEDQQIAKSDKTRLVGAGWCAE